MASLSQVLVLYMHFNIFQPWLKDQISCGWITTLKFVNFWFMQFAEFPCHHLHFICRWIYSRIKPALFLGIFSGGRCKSPWGSVVKCTWHSWLCDTHVASSTRSYSKCALPVTGMSWEIPEVCTTPAPHLAFTVPGSILNASLSVSSMWDFGWGMGISGTLLCCFCSLQDSLPFSSRVERHLISSDWDFISSACWRCKWERTDTCVWWAISSSIMSAIKASLPWRACASANFWCNEALCWAYSSCNSWALLALCPMPSSMLLNVRALAGEQLSSKCSGFIMACGRCLKNIAGTLSQTGKIIILDEQMNCVMNADSVKCP